MDKRFRGCVLRLVLLTLCLGATPAPALAQGWRLSGVVTDENGNPMPGVLVKAENQEGQSSSEGTTNDRGRYLILGLDPGLWTLTADVEGHTLDAVPVRLRRGQNPPVDFTLTRIRHALEILLGEAALKGLDPKVLETTITAADDLFNRQQYDQAIVAYEAILAKVPALTALYLSLGYSYQATREYDKAIAAYEEVLKNEPENADAKVAIARVNLATGDLEAASDTLAQTASRLDASREDLYNMGGLAFARGAVDEAAEWYEKARLKDPNWGKPLFQLGLVALNSGDTETAVTFFQQVIDVDPDSEEGTQAKALLQQLRP